MKVHLNKIVNSVLDKHNISHCGEYRPVQSGSWGDETYRVTNRYVRVLTKNIMCEIFNEIAAVVSIHDYGFIYVSFTNPDRGNLGHGLVVGLTNDGCVVERATTKESNGVWGYPGCRPLSADDEPVVPSSEVVCHAEWAITQRSHNEPPRVIYNSNTSEVLDLARPEQVDNASDEAHVLIQYRKDKAAIAVCDKVITDSGASVSMQTHAQKERADIIEQWKFVGIEIA